MKAVFIEQTGDASVLRYGDFAKPEPAAGQVLVKLAAAGVNFIDTYHRLHGPLQDSAPRRAGHGRRGRG